MNPAGGDTGRSDEDLIAEVLRGGTAAFGEMASRHRARIEGLCRRFFRDSELVRDLVQESLTRIFTGLAGFRSEMPFGGWMRAIVVNICYDELRRRQRRPEELVADFSDAEPVWLDMVTYASPESIVDAAEQRREAHQLAHRLLDSLRIEDRMAVVLKEAEEMSVAQIAEQMGWSEAKVKIRVFRARRAMRKQAERILAAVRR